MPSKNSVKIYSADGYYHLYNRGVEKRTIFQDSQDYSVFLSYLKTYLSPKNAQELRQKLASPQISWTEKNRILKLLRLNNFNDEITLLAYCLMPNHFHFLLKQRSANAIDIFMNSLLTRYVMYFNKKHHRVGGLFQDVYKAVLVESEDQLLYLTAYIHRNPSPQGDPLQSSQPSSYPDYLGLRTTDWVKPSDILVYFSRSNPSLSYQAFVNQTVDFTKINNLVFAED